MGGRFCPVVAPLPQAPVPLPLPMAHAMGRGMATGMAKGMAKGMAQDRAEAVSRWVRCGLCASACVRGRGCGRRSIGTPSRRREFLWKWPFAAFLSNVVLLLPDPPLLQPNPNPDSNHNPNPKPLAGAKSIVWLMGMCCLAAKGAWPMWNNGCVRTWATATAFDVT